MDSPNPKSPKSIDSISLEMLPMDKFKPRRRHISARRTNAHPYLFTLMTLIAAAELGLTAFLISAGNEIGTWSNPRYYSLLILLCFEAAWTLLFTTGYMLWVLDGGVQMLASVASSMIWLLLTALLWGTGAGIIHNARASGSCRPPLSRCRQSLTVEVLGWTEFSLCAVTLLATVVWLYTGRRGYSRDSRTYV